MKQTKFITLTAQKGGTGKTTLTFQVAVAMAASGKKILLVDMDPQANMTLKTIDLNINENTASSSANLFTPGAVVIPQKSDYENIDIIPATTTYLQITADLIASRPARERILYNFFKRCNFTEKYDYVFFDTGSGFGLLNQNVYYLADKIFLVAEPDEKAVSGVITFKHMWHPIAEALEKEDNICSVITNKVNPTLKKTSEYKLLMKELGYDTHLTVPYIPASVDKELYKNEKFKKNIEEIVSAIIES